MAAGIFLAMVNPSREAFLLPVAFAYGMFAFPLYALAVAHTNDFADESQYVEVACGLLLMYALGAVFGPIIASVFMRFLGPGGLFAFTALVHICTVVFVIYRLTRRAVTPQDEHIAFADALRVAGQVSSVDPLSHEHKKSSP